MKLKINGYIPETIIKEDEETIELIFNINMILLDENNEQYIVTVIKQSMDRIIKKDYEKEDLNKLINNLDKIKTNVNSILYLTLFNTLDNINKALDIRKDKVLEVEDEENILSTLYKRTEPYKIVLA